MRKGFLKEVYRISVSDFPVGLGKTKLKEINGIELPENQLIYICKICRRKKLVFLDNEHLEIFDKTCPSCKLKNI